MAVLCTLLLYVCCNFAWVSYYPPPLSFHISQAEASTPLPKAAAPVPLNALTPIIGSLEGYASVDVKTAERTKRKYVLGYLGVCVRDWAHNVGVA